MELSQALGSEWGQGLSALLSFGKLLSLAQS